MSSPLIIFSIGFCATGQQPKPILRDGKKVKAFAGALRED
jgi:hypothetical protein